MKRVLAFETIEDTKRFDEVTARFHRRLEDYREQIREYGVREVPKAVVWTSVELATSVFSDIPIPAYTSRDLIYMSPDVEEWRRLMVQQLDGRDLPELLAYYGQYSEDQMMVVLAHELTHHSDWFLDEFDEERPDGIWFEEGMCMYLPRRLLLSEKAFQQETEAERALVQAFSGEYGGTSLESFGTGSYTGRLPGIMFDYWRSYLAVLHLVEQADGDAKAVFDAYHAWHHAGRTVPLTEYFDVEKLFKEMR